MMTSKLRKAAVSAMAALTLSAALMATATPADAKHWRDGPRWHAGYWYSGYGWGAPVVATGLIGGVALGAVPVCTYAYGPVYYSCGWQNRPVYDAWGNFAGFAPVQMCY